MKKIFRFFILSLMMCCGFSYAKEIHTKDVLGREVVLKELPQRIVLGFYYTDYLAVGGVKALDKVVGFSKAVWTDWTPASWELYSKTLPELKKIADVGEVEVGTFSIEKVLSLKPDLLLLADWQYQVLEIDLEPIDKAGIPIVVIDYNRESPPLHILSTKILGQITGEEQRAKGLCEFYQNTLDQIQSTIAQANRAKPKVYVEFGNKGPSESGFTFGKNMWGPLIELAMGENIAKPFIEQWGPMNPEQILVSKPDVIFIAGRETELKKNKEAMVMGVEIPQNEAQKRLDGYKQRLGWSSLPAIKNNQLYGVYQGASRTLADIAMVQFIAQALYPDLFEGVDAQKLYIDFHKKYLPVIPSGTFVIQASSK